MSTIKNQAWHDRMEHPKTCAPDDFWGQIRRTVNGKPVSEDQIAMIRNAIRTGLNWDSDDTLLDLCCGNGALAAPFFDELKSYLGVDISPPLIEVAEKNFRRSATHTFLLQPVEDYVEMEEAPERFTKALCYGSFSYLSPEAAKSILTGLRTRFTKLQALFVGALPDRDASANFFRDRPPLPLDDHTSSIGYWYTENKFSELAASCGWRTSYVRMPDAFYQGHYRFNVIMTPKR